ncbi:MAG: DUF2924 domain-containing protein [Acidimicrobiales bacterium]
MKRAHRPAGTLDADLARLSNYNRQELGARWGALYGIEPPRQISRSLLVRAIAYRLQEKALGGLKPATRRLLARAAKDLAAGRPVAPIRPSSLKPGTRLVRVWQGTTHEVTILEDGVLFRGKRHRSLSEVARAITGSRWSGPRFFGLKANKIERSDGGT